MLVFLLCLEVVTPQAEGALFRGRRSLFSGRSGRGLLGLRRQPRRRMQPVSRNSFRNFNNSFIGDFGFRFNQFDAFFDPGIGVTGFPQGNINAFNFNHLAFPNFFTAANITPTLFLEGGVDPNRSQFGRGAESAQPEPAANPNDPCGIRFSAPPGGTVGQAEGYYYDRRSRTCQYGFRQSGGNPFPFSSEIQCLQTVRSGGCRFSNVEENQIIFRR